MNLREKREWLNRGKELVDKGELPVHSGAFIWQLIVNLEDVLTLLEAATPSELLNLENRVHGPEWANKRDLK